MWRAAMIGGVASVLALGSACETDPCAGSDVLPVEPASCSVEQEPCGGIDGPTCADGLECVSTVMCLVGPCPGTCLAPCEDQGDCARGEACEAPIGWDDRALYCVPAE